MVDSTVARNFRRNRDPKATPSVPIIHVCGAFLPCWGPRFSFLLLSQSHLRLILLYPLHSNVIFCMMFYSPNKIYCVRKPKGEKKFPALCIFQKVSSAHSDFSFLENSNYRNSLWFFAYAGSCSGMLRFRTSIQLFTSFLISLNTADWIISSRFRLVQACMTAVTDASGSFPIDLFPPNEISLFIV